MSYGVGSLFKPALIDLILTGPTDALPTAVADACVIRIWNASTTSSAIRGIAGGVHGRAIFIVLITGRSLTFPGGHVNPAVGNKLAVQDATNISTVNLSQSIHFVYDANFSGGGRWVQVGRVA
jgi:hypothetical protein